MTYDELCATGAPVLTVRTVAAGAVLCVENYVLTRVGQLVKVIA